MMVKYRYTWIPWDYRIFMSRKHSKVYNGSMKESIEHLTTYRNEVLGGVSYD